MAGLLVNSLLVLAPYSESLSYPLTHPIRLTPFQKFLGLRTTLPTLQPCIFNFGLLALNPLVFQRVIVATRERGKNQADSFFFFNTPFMHSS